VDQGIPNGRSPVLQSVARLLQEAEEALWHSEERAQLCIGMAAALLQKTSTAEPHRSAVPCARLAPWQVARVVKYIDANLGEKIMLPHLAEVIQISASHFSKKFRSTLGQTPHAFLLRRRIERARELIRETDWPLCQIALDCGLTDQAHLSKLFRRIVGVSPSAWRRMQKDPPSRCGRVVAIGGKLPNSALKPEV
jgi:AraC family transcriptional regulator